MNRELATADMPLLNRPEPYISEANRTYEDNESMVYDAESEMGQKRTHISPIEFNRIYNDTMRFFAEQERYQYKQVQSGEYDSKSFMKDVAIHLQRTFPKEMNNENDFNVMMERIAISVFQYDVLQPLIDNPETTDIKVCAPHDIRVRVGGKAYRSNAMFMDERDLYRFVEGLALRNHIDILSRPVITFTDKHDSNYILRFTISAPFVCAVDYPYLHIRKVSKVKPDFQELIRRGMLNEKVRDYLIDRAKLSKGLIFAGPPGCVDRETEFFNGKEWKSIADYQNGEKVLQFDTETNEASLVVPDKYIKEPCDMMYHFETSRGINQTLSPEHRVIYYNRTHRDNKRVFSSKAQKISAKELATRQNNGHFYGYFKTDFIYDEVGIPLTDIEIKLMLAVICDGTFHSKKENNRRCHINLKKQRKKDELENILKEWGGEYRRFDLSNGFSRFSFIAPRKEKEFTSDWYSCSRHQLQLICGNVLKWDGSIDKNGKKSFETTKKTSADFIQFAFSACGYRATIYTSHRKGKSYRTGGKTYIRQSDSYSIVISNQTMIGMAWHKDGRNNNVKLEEVVPSDGFKYCFTVPTHALVLRRKGKIFITGNSGKTSALNAWIEHIPKTRECLVIQENDELFTDQSGFMFKHVTHGFAGEPVCTLEDLGRMALVEGCNHFIIGEVKGGEMRNAMTLLNAGGYFTTTLHATNAREVLDKGADLVKYGSSYSFDEAKRMLKTIDTIVYMEGYKVREILEVDGYDDKTGQYRYIPIYKYDGD